MLDFASLYPSCFISNNMCYSTLLPPKAHVAPGLSTHRTPDTVGPNTRVPLACGVDDTRLWPGDAIAFVSKTHHVGLLPRLLDALIAERRAVKKRIKQLSSGGGDRGGANGGGGGTDQVAALMGVLNARQLTLKLLSNASYGFTGADTSHLCCKPLAEACLRFGNYYTRTASALIEAEGLGHRGGGGAGPRFPGAAVICKLRASSPSLSLSLSLSLSPHIHHTHTHTRTHTRAHTRAHTRTHIRTHAHAHTLRPSHHPSPPSASIRPPALVALTSQSPSSLAPISPLLLLARCSRRCQHRLALRQASGSHRCTGRRRRP